MQKQEDFQYMDDYLRRRIYQLKNHEEVYRKYNNYNHNLERDIASLELDLMTLCNMILSSGSELTPEEIDDLHFQASTLLWGALDTEAVELMKRCDSQNQLEIIHSP